MTAVRLRFDSAEPSERSVSPPGYRPHVFHDRLIYDDEVDDLAPSQPWRPFFAGGSNRAFWVRTGANGTPHFVGREGMDVRYSVYGGDEQDDGYHEMCDNAYDAFWLGDEHAGDLFPVPPSEQG